MTAVYTSILNQVQTNIKALSLTDIEGQNVVIVKKLTDDPKAMPGYPGVQISPFGNPSVRPGTNVRDDIVYPVLVATLAKNKQSQSGFRDRALQWLQSIRRAFINQRLTDSGGSTIAYTCIVDPRDSFNPEAWEKTIDLGAMILRFIARESRG